MYGREPERVAFLNKVKQAAWMLTRVIIANGWKVVGTEELLEGEFMDIPIKGYADLILKRGNEYCVVDLKWRGTNRRKALLKNREDLQLVLYAHLLHKNPWPHTAFFIIEETTLIARNQQAFKESIVEDFADDHQEVCKEILDKMEKTIAWRIQQLTSGQLEIRTEDTCRALDELYGGSIMELLELKSDNAPFDDYETLVR
jgi:predicted RecB family nuclease